MTSGTSSIRDPVLGRSSSLVVLRSVVAINSADSDQPHVAELVLMTGPTEGGVTITVTGDRRVSSV